MPINDLEGLGVLVTRPLHQSRELTDHIASRGGTPVSFPVIDIAALHAADIREAAEKLAAPDITVFVSANAVTHGLEYAAGQIAAIGPATAAAIRESGHHVDFVPGTGFDSEALFATLAQQDLNGKRVRIIRGTSGREKLAELLDSAHATTDYLSVYQTKLPEISEDDRRHIESLWHSDNIHAVVVMSVKSLENLRQLTPTSCQPLLQAATLVTPAMRVLKTALGPGSRAVLAAGTSPEEIGDALVSGRRFT